MLLLAFSFPFLMYCWSHRNYRSIFVHLIYSVLLSLVYVMVQALNHEFDLVDIKWSGEQPCILESSTKIINYFW